MCRIGRDYGRTTDQICDALIIDCEGWHSCHVAHQQFLRFQPIRVTVPYNSYQFRPEAPMLVRDVSRSR